MKKMIRTLIAVIVLIPLAVSAKGNYFENYLEELGTVDYYTGTFYRQGYSDWETVKALSTRAINLGQIINSSKSKYKFDKLFKTKALLFNDIEGIEATTSNEKVMTVNVKKYDFAAEKKYFEEYPKLYESYTLEEINSELANKYSAKPTWWAYNGYTSEPKTWYEAYGLTEEPTNVVEVSTIGHDLGVAEIKITATDKDPITINWMIYQDIFYDNNKEALLEFLANSDRYKNVIKGNQDYVTKNIYDIMYQVEEKSDVSDIVNALKGKDITINFDYYTDSGYTSSYFLNGKDVLQDAKEGLTYYYEATLYKSENKDAIDKLLGLDNLIYIDFAYHGELPAKYKTGIEVQSYAINSLAKKYGCSEEDAECYQKVYDNVDSYLENQEFTLLYYNKEKNQMEVIKKGLKANMETGLVYIELDHFSSYVLSLSNDYDALTKEEVGEENPQTGDNILSYVTLFTISAFALGFMYIKFMKNNE